MAEAAEKTEDFVGLMQAYVDAHGMLAAGAAVVVAVSGGADSVALGEALKLAGRAALHVAHVHHGLRQAADADADFVAALARRWAAPFHLQRIDTAALARQWGVGVEEAGRRGRYEALSAVAAAAGAPAVAVAHHADDQVETVLQRIARGTHLRGLAGMPARRRLADGVELIRPLLWARRSQIEQFCRARRLPWRQDHTNAETDFTRNFIRHELLPLMRRRLNLRTDEALLRLASAAADAQAVLDELAGALFERARGRRSGRELVLRLAPLRKAPPLLAATALRLALEELGAPQRDLSSERFADLLGLLSGERPAADLPGGIRARRTGQTLRLTRPGD